MTLKTRGAVVYGRDRIPPPGGRAPHGARLFIAPLLLLAACAGQVSGNATRSALTTFNEKVTANAPEGASAMEVIAGRAVDGAVTHLSDPAHVAALGTVVQSLTSQAVAASLSAASAPGRDGRGSVEALGEDVAGTVRRSITMGVASDLGDDGHGVLGQSLAATVRNSAAAATDGALGRLFPECTAGEERCLDRRLAEISEGAGAAFVRGVRHSLGFVPLVLAFTLGILCALAALLIARWLRGSPHRRRDLFVGGDHPSEAPG